MAKSILENQARFAGYIGEDECEISFSSNLVSTTIIGGLTATKEADKKCWVDGPLHYTITIENDCGDTVTGLVLTDHLDPALVTLDESYGVYINDTTPAVYTFTAGTLSVHLPPIAHGDTVTVSFRVLQV